MQILGKRSRISLIAVAVFMLTALGLSFALWDTSAVKAAGGDASIYANAKVGDIVTFGQYYQTPQKDADGEFIKTPLEWIVVDKNERTGELTLMSRYILAAGCYFGNYYNNQEGKWGAWYDNNETVGNLPYNQAYVDSTVRAYLNNLERLDLGGDGFTSGIGYVPSKFNSSLQTGLLSSVGFSNKKYWTGLNYETEKQLVDSGELGLHQRETMDEVYYQRPIKNDEYKNRPATRGFYDEAFNAHEKSMIAPKLIAGYTGHRWPDSAHDMSTKSYVEGAYDKVWLPSTTELNVMQGVDWDNNPIDAWDNPSDSAGSTVFKYFKHYDRYGFKSVTEAVKAVRTELAKLDSFAMNFSIPVYKRLAEGASEITINTDIHKTSNTSNHYWTRTPSSRWFSNVRFIENIGVFAANNTCYDSNFGVRPCVIIRY